MSRGVEAGAMSRSMKMELEHEAGSRSVHMELGTDVRSRSREYEAGAWKFKLPRCSDFQCKIEKNNIKFRKY